ncbi:hypothetical protein JJD41_12895 [Oxynema sp. CENA135]|uniref:hypothetical protein n=1 Tax=Oxynema sp. CENA135 TaxID=984206 RepID=UPI00190DD2F5|nr:hypothetical protein [Oxynema sp. CENA135]MBK4730754.1 hypothetical protein [Oxynema sp. CENA135]
MGAKTNVPKLSLEQVIERIFSLRQITRLDQQILMSTVLSKESLSEREHSQIDRIFEAVQRGAIRVV